jgi:ABC-type sugar transport system ATPase subunit
VRRRRRPPDHALSPELESVTGTLPPRPVALRATAISKSFPGTQALDDLSFDLLVGEIHGLVGENGAGKTTFVKIITGAFPADTGSVEVFGEILELGDPRAHKRAGIAAIYQDLTIVPEMSAAGNVFLGRPRSVGPFVSRSRTERDFEELATRVGVAIDPNARAGSLSVAMQQMLEIMRVLAADHRILILDEPTSSLGPAEREHLYEVIRGLREEGVSTIYISHDLDEILAHCDSASVMRDGRLVATAEVRSWTKHALVTTMLGRTLREPPVRRRPIGERTLLRVASLTIPGALEDIAFTLRRGEILGFAGLLGSGRTKLLRALAGAEPTARGRLFVNGKEVSWPRTVRAALKLGIALAPEDRKSEGLHLSLSAAANITLSDMRAVARGPVLSKRRQLRRATEVADPLAFDVSRLRSPAETFSGGNQQKLVVAKWLHRRPDVLLMDEFARGIDIGAKAELLAVMANLADEGLSLIVVSSEFEDLVAVADRVLVLARRQLIGELSGHEASVERILRLVFAVETATGGVG